MPSSRHESHLIEGGGWGWNGPRSHESLGNASLLKPNIWVPKKALLGISASKWREKIYGMVTKRSHHCTVACKQFWELELACSGEGLGIKWRDTNCGETLQTTSAMNLGFSEIQMTWWYSTMSFFSKKNPIRSCRLLP